MERVVCKTCGGSGEIYDEKLADWVPCPEACTPIAQLNKAFIALGADPALVKAAQAAVSGYIKQRMAEDGFGRRIIPPVQITDSPLDKQVDTDKPVKVLAD